MLAACGVVLAGVVLLLANDDLLSGLRSNRSDKPVIGHITFMKNDTRHKDSSALEWLNAKEDQGIHMGDSLFTGKKSSAQVELKKGGVIDLGENSLVVFKEVQGENLANINFGNFRVKANGTIKVAVGGHMTTIKGKNSDLQIFVDKHKKAQIRLLQGEAEVAQKQQAPVKLESRSIASLEAPEETPEPEPIPEPVTEAAAPEPEPLPPEPVKPAEIPLEPKAGTNQVAYTWRLYDLYDQREFLLFEKDAPPSKVKKTYPLAWGNQGATESVFVQHSSTEDFATPTTNPADGGALTLTELYLGDNFWRVSRDQQAWSPAQKITVTGQFLEGPGPVVTADKTEVALIHDVADTPVHLQPTFEAMGFVVEASGSDQFPRDATKAFWSSQSNFRVSFYKPGDYFYRFRAVNTAQELSNWSEPIRFKVHQPATLPAPILTKNNLEGWTGETLDMGWAGPAKAKSWDVEVRDEQNNMVDALSSEQPQLTWQAVQPGKYKARVYALDAYGRRGAPSKDLQMLVKDKPVVAKEEPKKKKEKERKPAAQEKSVAKMEQEEQKANENFWRSKLQVEGIFADTQSKEQIDQGIADATNMRVGVRALHWWGKHGVEGHFKKDVGNVSGAPFSSQDIEARYHRQFYFMAPWQVTAFGGYEIYRNSSAGLYYSPGYSLVKFGTSVEMPVWTHWNAGGEVALGTAMGKGFKYELAAHLDYFYRPNWSLGLGFRLQLFDAGTEAQSPTSALPFREGFSETFSTFTYYY